MHSSIPPPRDLSPARVAVRKQHLLAEVAAARRPLPIRRAALALVSAAAAVALLLAAPWGSSHSLTDRALAAVGDGPVLHVITEQQSPNAWFHPVDIATGESLSATLRTEIWFEPERKLEKTVSTLNGKPFENLLQSPEGWFTEDGPAYTCAWIAAHPIEATKARVSCNADMDNGTTPRQIPESPPTLDPALAGFVDRYRSALASGEATRTGTGRVDGRDVIWLSISRPEEDVALDATSYKPVLVKQGSHSFRVTEMETEPYEPSLFARPALEPPKPSIGEIVEPTPISLEQAREILGVHARWLGESWNGYTLAEIRRETLTTGYGPLSGRDPTRSTGVAFEYRANDGSLLTIREAKACEMAYGWVCGLFPLPEEGTALTLPFGHTLLVRDGVFVAIWQPPAASHALEAARALKLLSGARTS